MRQATPSGTVRSSPDAAAWGRALRQAALILLLVGVVVELTVLHMTSVARSLFVIGALGIAWVSMRRSPWDYLTATLWFWTISPFVRRVIDYYGGFESTNLVLLTPSLLALPMLQPILTSRRLMTTRETATGLLLLGPVLYGLAVSFCRGEIFPGMAAATEWLIPLLYYFYLIHLSRQIQQGIPHLRAFIVLNIAVIGIYGVIQCFDPPAWDTQWVEDVKMFSMRGAEFFPFKPFSMLNSPGTCAAWLSALILLSLHFRNQASVLFLPAAVFFLALTQVRANIGGAAVGLIAALAWGHRQMARSLLLIFAVLAVVAGGLAVTDPRLGETLSARFGTVGNLSEDESARARTELYKEFPALIERYPLGVGIGAIGREALGGNGGAQQGEFASIDSGLVAAYLALGWIGGTVYCVGLVALVGQAMIAAARSRSPAAMALAIAALGGAVTIGFTNLVGLQGLIVWLCAGYASAIGIRSRAIRNERPEPPAPAYASASSSPVMRAGLR